MDLYTSACSQNSVLWDFLPGLDGVSPPSFPSLLLCLFVSRDEGVFARETLLYGGMTDHNTWYEDNKKKNDPKQNTSLAHTPPTFTFPYFVHRPTAAARIRLCSCFDAGSKRRGDGPRPTPRHQPNHPVARRSSLVGSAPDDGCAPSRGRTGAPLSLQSRVAYRLGV